MPKCPHCNHALSAAELRTLWAKFRSSLRTVHSGGTAGRPKSADRCACGEMTVKRAAQRKHKCETTTEKTNMTVEIIWDRDHGTVNEGYYARIKRMDGSEEDVILDAVTADDARTEVAVMYGDVDIVRCDNPA